jgi:glycylpeptide N-tetradecanoyltransferase
MRLVASADATPTPTGPAPAPVTKCGFIRAPAAASSTPLRLVEGYTWCDLDVGGNPRDLGDLQVLLEAHYIQGPGIRPMYSADLLAWALRGSHPDLVVGVRNPKGALVACIAGVPLTMRLPGVSGVMPVLAANFLCIAKALRGYRLVPVLARELVRRAAARDLHVGVFTGLAPLGRQPVASAVYFHRALHVGRAAQAGFCDPATRPPLLSEKIHTEGLRPMVVADVTAVRQAVTAFQAAHTALALEFGTDEECAAALLPRPGVVDTYVVPGPPGAPAVALVSWFWLPSRHAGLPTPLRNTFVHCMVPGPGAPAASLLRDAMVLAKTAGADVMTGLYLGPVAEALVDCGFTVGTGGAHYFLYNWRCPPVEHHPAVALVLP